MASLLKSILVLCLMTLLVPCQLLADVPDPKMVATNTSRQQPKPQTACPVMGGPIDKALYVDAKGKRIYLCCAACEEAIRAEPDKYIKKIEQRGQTVEDAPSQE